MHGNWLLQGLIQNPHLVSAFLVSALPPAYPPLYCIAAANMSGLPLAFGTISCCIFWKNPEFCDNWYLSAPHPLTIPWRPHPIGFHLLLSPEPGILQKHALVFFLHDSAGFPCMHFCIHNLVVTPYRSNKLLGHWLRLLHISSHPIRHGTQKVYKTGWPLWNPGQCPNIVVRHRA